VRSCLSGEKIQNGPKSPFPAGKRFGFHERLEKIAVRAKRNAAVTSSALDLAVDESGRVDTSSRPIRVEYPDSMARRRNGATYQNPMGGNACWGSLHWKVRSFNVQ
jgi:hypothetical protein